MDLKLAKDEKIIKDWCYFNSTVESKKASKNITITNKRLISSNSSADYVDYEEIPLKNITGVKMNYDWKAEHFYPVSLFVLAGICFLVSIIFLTTLTLGVAIVMSIACLGLAIFLLVIGIKKKTFAEKGSFNLVIYTTQKTEALTTNAYVRVGEWSSRVQNQTGVTELKLDKQVALDIVQSLGAIIIDQQAPSDEVEMLEDTNKKGNKNDK